jgi:glycosyltransferase involved in cell wall biosynthesis
VTTGGMDRANYALASYLARQGHVVHLVAHRVAEDLQALPTVRFHRVAKPLRSYLLGMPLIKWAGQKWAGQLMASGGRVIANGGNGLHIADVNWVHYVHAAYTPPPIGALPRRAVSWLRHRMFLDEERRALGSARLVIANSERTRRDLIDTLGVPPDRVHTVYYGIDDERVGPASAVERVAVRTTLGLPTDRPVLAFVGTLEDRRKGFDTLFRSWQTIGRNPDWDAILLVIGVGAELATWQRRVEQEGLVRGIRFLGFRRDVPELLRACDGLVSPTRYEAYGLAVHEALCSGVPALVSSDAGVAERYSQGLRPLLLPNPEDADDLAQRLLLWRAGRETFRHQTLLLSEQLRRWSWDDMAARIVELMTASAKPALHSVPI